MNKNKITLSLAAALTLGFSTSTMAAGFQLAEYSATGLGRAFAGEAAMADNASAQFRNPAMLTYLEGTQVSVGAIYVDPNIDVEGDLSIAGHKVSTTKASDIAHSAVIPNFYISHRVNEQWAVGLAMATNYGMETELGGDFMATLFGDQANIMSVEINPNVAYKINDQFSIGAGVRYVMGEGHFGASVPTNLPPMLEDAVDSWKGQNLKYMEGDDSAWGWQLGGAWQINENHRIGVNYRSAVDLKLKGEASGLLYGGVHSGSMALTLPATAEIASFHQLTDKLAMHASFNWTDWSSFDKLEANIPSLGATPDLIKEENWEDNYRIALGATYQYTSKLAVRTGVAYDTSAVSSEHRTQTIPETDRLWLSLGAGYQWSDALSFDAGFTYIFAKDASMSETEVLPIDQGIPVNFTGETTGNVWLVGVQANYKF
ncbi:aromatic hydrocarbon degradation protein [Photobacterium gaetbulicola]|uniref:Putative long-chain fatty acid transport protein n=1 Tax=Photobacterium gaetbulicola Gung47 TaxID=658445 RepID=A0A0C5W8H1_9GAMM|nr:outer membrane protein transport protein [Photobacterium gaetbulicola]AJR07841.1 putative long-chain fatty acid transport protein [Photobacterium gaetbulicola Gung47]PSU03206.1 aromatic hydrocarbon degradation protein [Photobacterium gaetbulicola]